MLLKMGISIKIHILYLHSFFYKNQENRKIAQGSSFSEISKFLLDYVFTMHFKTCAAILYTYGCSVVVSDSSNFLSKIVLI